MNQLIGMETPKTGIDKALSSDLGMATGIGAINALTSTKVEGSDIGLSSLEQRTHELLIRRAIGASRTNIVTLVLGSQLILSIFVCFAAILISLILVHCIGILLPVDSPVGIPSYPISVAIIAVTMSMLTALCGGLLPALKAAKLEPALALR